ncbi:response regulator transcription factor [Gordonia hankookensis]|uniref:Response regulator transcription factor n=1 Tax=Gordonia hankookensis TaxID=589403 RepID=A0ABR7WFY8_9ACTN|nr:response regulator transcription factor [Gordonia hankookensis]MBD1321328.1 response regulator transcription factor [Gordonia hankookensis]NDZ97080.1 response regulator transcription factor [Streptomyces sp. SID11726]NEB22799.1 response regulator transcription factor [Streptomyces sp. SID6673]
MRVLVVDDDVRAAETVRRVLASEGWSVVVATDGAEGLWRAAEEQFDVVVLDIMLPKLNGFRVVQEMRERKIWTPVLMLSAKDGEYDQAEALDYGADDYLVKPFSVVVLKAHLRAVMRRGGRERPAILTAGSLTMDPAERKVARGDTTVTLTPREYALLEFLIRNKETVVSKRLILESIWDENYEGDENIVEVYIRYLRKRIDDPFGVRSIETVRGAGYRLCEV